MTSFRRNLVVSSGASISGKMSWQMCWKILMSVKSSLGKLPSMMALRRRNWSRSLGARRTLGFLQPSSLIKNGTLIAAPRSAPESSDEDDDDSVLTESVSEPDPWSLLALALRMDWGMLPESSVSRPLVEPEGPT